MDFISVLPIEVINIIKSYNRNIHPEAVIIKHFHERMQNLEKNIAFLTKKEIQEQEEELYNSTRWVWYRLDAVDIALKDLFTHKRSSSLDLIIKKIKPVWHLYVPSYNN